MVIDNNFRMKKNVKITFPGDKETTQTERDLFQVALFELMSGSLSDVGITFGQPVSIENSIVIEVEYPMNIRERINNPVKKKDPMTLSDQDYIMLLEKLVEKYSGKKVGQCIYESVK